MFCIASFENKVCEHAQPSNAAFALSDPILLETALLVNGVQLFFALAAIGTLPNLRFADLSC